MNAYKHYYVLTSCDVVPAGFSFQCWMSTVNAFFDDSNNYPHYYDRGEGNNIWHVRANCELTNKAVAMIVEYANRLIVEQRAINDRRKVANR